MLTQNKVLYGGMDNPQVKSLASGTIFAPSCANMPIHICNGIHKLSLLNNQAITRHYVLKEPRKDYFLPSYFCATL